MLSTRTKFTIVFLVDRHTKGFYFHISTRFFITISVLHKLLVAQSIKSNLYYIQCLFKQFYFLHFKLFQISILLWKYRLFILSEISLTSVEGKVKQGYVSFKKMQHKIKEEFIIIRFTDEKFLSLNHPLKVK